MKLPLILINLLIFSCNQHYQTRTVIRQKIIVSEDSIFHPEINSNFAFCPVDTLKDSNFVYVYQNLNVDSGYIYSKLPPQPLYYQNGKFVFAIDQDKIILNQINN